MQYTTDAINIKSYPLGDSDNILLMYSKENGLIKCVAKGAKKPNSKLGARAQVLIANKLLLNKGRNFDKITQAQALNTFSKIRKDFDKLSYSLYLADVISIFCKDTEDDSEEIYNIFYKSLENISNSNDKTQVLLSVLKFQINLMQHLGWGIDFKICAKCGAEIEDYSLFSMSERNVFCTKCAFENNTKLVKIPKKIADFLCEIKNTDLSEKTKYDDLIDIKTGEICFGFMKDYLENLSGKKQKFEDFSENFSLNK